MQNSTQRLILKASPKVYRASWSKNTQVRRLRLFRILGEPRSELAFASSFAFSVAKARPHAVQSFKKASFCVAASMQVTDNGMRPPCPRLLSRGVAKPLHQEPLCKALVSTTPTVCKHALALGKKCALPPVMPPPVGIVAPASWRSCQRLLARSCNLGITYDWSVRGFDQDCARRP